MVAVLATLLVVPATPAGAGPHLASAPAATTNVAARAAQSCPAAITQLSAGERDRALRTAARRMAAYDRPPRRALPFGAFEGARRVVRTSPTAWTAGFYPATLWSLYEATGQRRWLTAARRWTAPLLPVARYRGSHDLGFMVGLPAGLGARLDPSRTRRQAYSDAVVRAARTLAERWNPRVGLLKSADYGDRWGVIVDSAMNAPLLLEAAPLVGPRTAAMLRARGSGHLRTLARTFLRADGSTFHRLAFDPESGAMVGPIPGQGLDPASSAWARGQAWAVYGLAWGYRLTGDGGLLEASRRAAQYWYDHVTSGCVPAYDLSVTAPDAPRDSSASAIVAAGLQQLATVDPDPALAAQWRGSAALTLGTLARGAPWTPARDRRPGFLRRQAYSIPMDRREGTYVWGDHYLVAALAAAD